MNAATLPCAELNLICETGATSRRLLIIDDHPIFRHGLKELLSGLPDVNICGEAGDARSALEAVRESHPDIALLDVSIPGVNGLELINVMLTEQANLKIIVLSIHDESVYALRALRAGAKGYLEKHHAVNHLVEAIRQVAGDRLYISPRLRERLIFKFIQGSHGDVVAPLDKLSVRELEIFRHVGSGKSNREIARSLGLSVKTVETHRSNIKEKLGLATSGEMINFATEWNETREGLGPARSVVAAPALAIGGEKIGILPARKVGVVDDAKDPVPNSGGTR